MRRMLRSLTALALLVACDAAQALEVRFYPGKLHSYEIDAVRGIRGVVLQNMAIINDGEYSGCALLTASRVVRIDFHDASSCIFAATTPESRRVIAGESAGGAGTPCRLAGS